jgi:mono/diheme cytochrome c family protein
MAQRTRACTVCHGDQGRAGPDGYYPRLAGKPAAYLYQQLLNFRTGRRHYAPMTGLLDTLDDGYLHALADYFSAQSAPYPAPPATTATAADQEHGRKLVQEGNKARGLPACTQCHGLQLTGVNPDVPGLLGLPADYINAQLGGWQTGQRGTAAPDCMAAIAKRLTAADIHAAARWLSAQPVPMNARAADHKLATSPANLALRCADLAVPQSAPAATEPRGAYLARVGNCAHCHSARGGAAYAGGRALETPFGAVFSSNITPDRTHGIGAWSADDFWRALHHGEAKGGRLLYPAFPYTSFTHISRADSDALLAYLQTVPAQAQANRPHALRWPFSSQIALRAWRMLFFSPAASEPVVASLLPPGNAELQRGAYLVQGLGHCQECHGARNALGALTGEPQGSVLPGSQWFAPSLNDLAQASVSGWTVDEIARFLQTGVNDKAVANGPMAEVVLHGTQYLSDADARAMASYLKSLPQTATKATRSVSVSAGLASGAKLYENHCADCHGLQGQGRAPVYPALAGNRVVRMDNGNNLVLSVLGGGFAPATAGHARPFGMPPFVLQLNDSELAAVLTYVRNAWGNQASALSEFDINKLRRSQAP